jgi:glutamate carboxypeptidase
MADVRVQRVASWDGIERRVRERVARTLVPDTKVDVVLERRRPPLEPTDASRSLAAHAQRVYSVLGRTLRVASEGQGGATDAAFAALENRGAVIEGLGLLGAGAHSNDAEYIFLSSVEPRLYLLSRLIMDAGTGKN